MNWKSISRGGLAAIVSVGLGLGTTACSRDYTVAFVYATASTLTTSGVIDGYQVDYQSGALTQLANSPTPSMGRNPVTLVASPSGKYLYVLNHDDNNVVEFAVGTDGKIYAQHTYNTSVGSVSSSFPVSAAVDPTGTVLYVVCTYQPGFGFVSPGPGDVLAYPITASDGSLGTPTQYNVGMSPIAVAASQYVSGASSNFIYVAERDTSVSGSVLTFSHATGTATLAAVNPAASGLPTGTPSGVTPSALAVDPTARFLYVTDATSNQLIGYTLAPSGLPSAMINGPFATGSFPSSITVDPRAKYMYVTNFNSSTVSAYVIDQATGNPTSANSGTGATGTNPTCVAIEPALGIYLFTSNNADQTITALQLSPNNGTLKNVQNTPFLASALPSCLVAVSNGSHATQVVDR